MHRVVTLVYLLLFAMGCVEPYETPEIKEELNIMVIDGFINSTAQSASVKLSYANPLAATETNPFHDNATVRIEEEGGNSYLLTQEYPGSFVLINTSFSTEMRYRLRVQNNSGREFVSNYITLNKAPEIDSITWKMGRNGISFSVNTHDDTNRSKYYQWNYVETWEYVSSFYSTYQIVNAVAIPRPQEDGIYFCWSSSLSTNINIGSSVRLANDVIQDFELTFIPANSVKLSRRYSILVEQRVLTEDAYEFWTQLQKSSESLGGLFDPQPSQVLGNIRSNNNDEIVLGYFSGGEVTQKRFFISFNELPREIRNEREPVRCGEMDLSALSVEEIPTAHSSVLLIDPIYVQGVGIVAFTTAAASCIDCRMQGGITLRPDFW